MNGNNQQVMKNNGVGNHVLQHLEYEKQFGSFQQGSPRLLMPRLDIRLDYENLHITLKKELDWKPNAQALIRAISEGVKHLGAVVRIVDYADWDRLSQADSRIFPKWRERSWQRDLAAMGVETRYLVNEDNRNAVDIQMTNDLRDLLERPADAYDTADLIILGTNDSDFRAVLEAARRRRRRFVLLAVKGQLSHRLVDVIDLNDIYYIDGGLHLHNYQK